MMAKSDSRSPTRIYVILEEDAFDDAGCYYTEVLRVEARNRINALREAGRQLRRQDPATLVSVPASMWQPTPVLARQREDYVVEVGGGVGAPA